MQRSNHNETNGILIGPELSRIFAEIIMQSIDNNIIRDLESYGLTLGKDYQIFRYVDDFFLFYNEEDVFTKIKNNIQINLKHYKMILNKHKEEKYSRPIITPITIAKKKIAKLLSDNLFYNLSEDKNLDEKTKDGSIYINQNSLSTEFKTILFDSGITYSDVLNYSLSIIEKKVKKILKDYKGISCH